MKNTTLFFSFAVIVSLFNPACGGTQQKDKSIARTSVTSANLVKPLINKNHQYVDGCSYYFYSPGEGPTFHNFNSYEFLFLANYDKTGWINILGEVKKLSLTPDYAHNQHKKGGRFIQVYEGGGVTVSINGQFQNVGLESFYLLGTITVKEGNQEQIIKVEGGGGC
jgi:hypothetical protein